MIMIITLIILSVLSLLFVITNSSVTSIQERVDISAYFKIGLAESNILVVRDEIAEDPRVEEVRYISADEALRNFKEKHKNDELILESVNELSENPLPATLQVKATNLEDYPAIAELLNSERYDSAIDTVNFEDNRVIIDRLNALLRFIITFGLALMTINNRREEVEIMRLVGATNWYIRGPYIVEALMYSFVATVVTSALLLPVYFNFLPRISAYLTPEGNIFDGNLSTFITLVLAQLLIAFGLSTISSLLAIRRYLKI